MRDRTRQPNNGTPPPGLIRMMLVMLLVATGTRVAPAQIAVVVHPSSPVDNLTLTELKRIYSGEVTTFSDLCIQTNLGDRFFEVVMDKNMRAVRKIWVKVMLSGQASQGPISHNTDEKVLDYIREHEGAIGFIHYENVPDDVKVVRVNGLGPEQTVYVLK
ncbi:MAG: substrate-binding domain-containing protein [Rhodothermales bacterium]